MARPVAVVAVALAAALVVSGSAGATGAPNPVAAAGPSDADNATNSPRNAPANAAAAPCADGTEADAATTDPAGTAGAANAEAESEAESESDSNGGVTAEFEPSYDPETVLDRVERLRDLRATDEIVLHEYPDATGTKADAPDRYAGIRPAGATALQLYSNESTERRRPLGYTVERGGTVHVSLMDAEALDSYGVSQEVVLAHELVHALQFQNDIVSPSRSGFSDDFETWSTDAQLVATSVVEGDAMCVTVAYDARHGDGGGRDTVAQYNDTLPRAAWTHSVGGTPYYYGFEFYRRTGAGPDERNAVIENPPASTTQLLHPNASVGSAALPPGPPAELELGGGERDGGETLARGPTDRVGELLVRHALRINGQPYGQAADAADGWTDGRMYYYQGERNPVHWVTVWQNESEATEFRTAWRDMLTDLGGTTADGTLRVPATDSSPATYYVLTQTGDTVRVTAASSADLAKRLANGTA